MTDHFSIDVYPEDLRLVAKKLGQMQDHLSTKGKQASATPGDIGNDWTGAAAEAIKPEMTGLGTQMTTSATKFHTSEAALNSLAKDFDSAQEQVAELNKLWAAADKTYDDAVAKAKTSYDKTSDAADKTGGAAGNNQRREAGDTQTAANGDAYTARAKTQGDLGSQFGLMKIWLAGQTKKAGDGLAGAAPSPVTDQQVNDWENGQYPTRLSHPGLIASMKQAAAREKAQIEAEQKAAFDAKTKEATKDLEHLEDILDNDDATPEEIKAALDQIGDKSKDPLYTKALLHAFGDDPSTCADRLNDLYDDLADRTPTGYEAEEIFPSLQKFNDAIAHGLTQYGDGAVATFAHQFMDNGQGPKRWALLSDSDYADGRMNSVALAYMNRIYTHDDSNSSGYDPFTNYLAFAFGSTDGMLDQFQAHGSGADLARMIKAAPDEDARNDLLDELTNTMRDDGYDMDEDDFKRKADLFGDALKDLIAGGKDNSQSVEQMLEVINRPGFPYSDDLLPKIQEALDDPKALTWIIQEVRYGNFSAKTLTEAFKSTDIDAGKLVGQMINYEISQGLDPSRLANDIGYLLGTDDLLGQSIDPSGVIKSLAGSVAGLNPVTGAAYGVFSALFDEMEKMEQEEQDWDDGWGNEKAQRLLSFTIYAQSHGGQVPGFDQWVTEHDRKSDPDAIIDFYQDQEDKGSPVFKDLDKLRTDIDEARDEE